MSAIRRLKLPLPVFTVEAYEKILQTFLGRGSKAALKVAADAKLADYYRPLKPVSDRRSSCVSHSLSLNFHLNRPYLIS